MSNELKSSISGAGRGKKTRGEGKKRKRQQNASRRGRKKAGLVSVLRTKHCALLARQTRARAMKLGVSKEAAADMRPSSPEHMAIGNESASATEIVIVTMGMDVNASGIARTSLGAAISIASSQT
jgi:hypothetical protein